VGGSSALNYMIINRASKQEYDAWAEIGNDGWDWAGILPSFKSSYNWTAMTQDEIFPSGLNATDANAQDQPFVGSGGVIQVSESFLAVRSRAHAMHLHRPLTTRITPTFQTHTFKP